jgi:hypothetical protein
MEDRYRILHNEKLFCRSFHGSTCLPRVTTHRVYFPVRSRYFDQSSAFRPLRTEPDGSPRDLCYEHGEGIVVIPQFLEGRC